ncbi:hypothetical protein CpB0930 [Chlamydia pneumoniae TW-183]|uniref:Uncharacterized protein n=1 Tax=Chlamydia pneumoniae TaxID=83558 RepID=A0ABN3YQG8_CHLPN|nr:hypothetical protein CpB0930 [Chlamydia pneumoniae TW-183]
MRILSVSERRFYGKREVRIILETREILVVFERCNCILVLLKKRLCNQPNKGTCILVCILNIVLFSVGPSFW